MTTGFILDSPVTALATIAKAISIPPVPPGVGTQHTAAEAKAVANPL